MFPTVRLVALDLSVLVAALALVAFAYLARLVSRALFPSTHILRHSKQVALETRENDREERRQEREKQRLTYPPPNCHIPDIDCQEEVQYPTQSLESDDSSEHSPARDIPNSSIRTFSSSASKEGGSISPALKRLQKGVKLIRSTSHRKRF